MRLCRSRLSIHLPLLLVKYRVARSWEPVPGSTGHMAEGTMDAYMWAKLPWGLWVGWQVGKHDLGTWA